MKNTTILWFLALGACPETPNPPEEPSPLDVARERCAAPVAVDALSYVDPFIGTGGRGAETANVSPGASAPFGMSLVGPDTRTEGGLLPFYHWAGYHYDDDQIYGFTHTHAHGMGVADYGGVAFMPAMSWDDAYTDTEGRMLRFSHEGEVASPGRYAVAFEDVPMEVDIVATTRGAHSKVSWPEGNAGVLIFDIGHVLPQMEVFEGSLEVDLEAGELVGFQRLDGSYSSRFGGVRQHFYATFDPAPVASGGWTDPADPTEGLTAVEGIQAGLWLEFPEGTTEVNMRLALSSTGEAGARANHAAELEGLSLEEQLNVVEGEWEDLLGKVRVSGASDEDMRTFYTAMYHAALMPSRHDDADGTYRGVDQEIHTADFNYYSDMSLWDTFRTTHPFYALVWPQVQLDSSRSLVQMYKDGGSLPRWPMAHGYTSGMVGTPAVQVLAESYLKGLTDFDVDAGYEASVKHATQEMPSASRKEVEETNTLGYLANESSSGSVSRMLENAWSDHALGLWAEAMGESEDAERFLTQSQRWKNIWNADAGFFTARNRDGSFVWEGNEFVWLRDYVEGNSWHYVWYVPYDVDEMIAVQHDGDRDAWIARYTEYWREGVFEEEEDYAPDDWYWHGNEPVMHYAFLGSLAGKPDLSIEASRWVMQNRYFDTPEGIDGNEDGGTLSAWYLWAALGMYPVAGTVDYAMTSPNFECVEIDVGEDRVWKMFAPDAGPDKPYVAGLWVDGESEDRSVLQHDYLFGAEEVIFEMAETPQR